MLAIRWTIGDVNPRGFEALRASLYGAWQLFGVRARYRVYVNTISIKMARERTGVVPAAVEWCLSDPVPPHWLRSALDGGVIRGVAWKLLPPRAFPDDHELYLDNDLVLWKLPPAILAWLAGDVEFVLAADVRSRVGRFAHLCGSRPLNTSIRGLPPHFPLDEALANVLARVPGTPSSELDEQGLQCAALLAAGRCGVVELDDVSICSPFLPHSELGSCGAHFVGLNTPELGGELDGRRAEYARAEHWDLLHPAVSERVALPVED